MSGSGLMKKSEGGKDRARQPDAEGEHQNRNGGKTGRAGERASGISDIPDHPALSFLVILSERRTSQTFGSGQLLCSPPIVREILRFAQDDTNSARSFTKGSLGSDSIFDDAAVEQVNGAVGVLRKARIVRDHANGGATGVQFLQQIHNGFAVARVEVSRRLIRQQNRRLPGKRASDRDTLLLPAGKLAW